MLNISHFDIAHNAPVSQTNEGHQQLSYAVQTQKTLKGRLQYKTANRMK